MYRTVDCATWDDPWFTDLAPTDKLLFLYLLTNRRSTPCGAFEITPRQIAFETGLTEQDIKASLPHLAPKIIWWPDIQVVWLRNFYKHQRANSSEKYVPAARRALVNFAPCVQAEILKVYPELGEGIPTQLRVINTLPIGYEMGIDGVSIDKDELREGKKKEKDTADADGASASEQPFQEFFTQFWQSYPRKANKQAAEKAARKVLVRDRPKILASVGHYLNSTRVLRGFIKDPDGFLKLGYWQTFELGPLIEADAMLNEHGPPGQPTAADTAEAGQRAREQEAAKRREWQAQKEAEQLAKNRGYSSDRQASPT